MGSLLFGKNYVEGRLLIPEGMPAEEALNDVIKVGAQDLVVDTNLISDGYHTFRQLYDHRIILYIALCKVLSKEGKEVWKSTVHSDETSFEGWFLLGVNKAAGEQITYHLPESMWDDCYFAEELAIAPPFDDHSSEDILERLSQL